MLKAPLLRRARQQAVTSIADFQLTQFSNRTFSGALLRRSASSAKTAYPNNRRHPLDAAFPSAARIGSPANAAPGFVLHNNSAVASE